jgi:hypothetical protein
VSGRPEAFERPILFLTDFGYEDEFAGACRAVIERFAPGARVIDLTHGIPPGDVRRGALALEAVAGRAGPAVYLAVVDPGVGTERRGVAVRAGESFLVGPDNGLLALAARRLGGAAEAVDVSASALRLEPTAPTFHGRDVFAPVAAHLAAGRPLGAAGEPLDPAALIDLALPRPRLGRGEARAHVLYADRYGNLVLDVRAGELELGEAVTVEAAGSSHRAAVAPTFGAVAEGELALYGDSSGWLGLAVNRGSAAELLGVGRDDEVVIRAKGG